jgi:hypothetical protein
MGVPAAGGPGRVFISYRRDDAAYPAGWLFDRLASGLGRDKVFKDVDSIEPGDDFAAVIRTAVGSCDVLLALIGDRWLTITGKDGQRRLDDPGDFVRLEIEAALARGIRVIPVLVAGVRMPPASQFPASLAELTRRQTLELSPVRFESDTARLLKVLDKTLREAHAAVPLATLTGPRIQAETHQAPAGHIANLRSPAEVTHTQVVCGAVIGVPSDSEPWLLVMPAGDGVYYPQQAITVDSNGDFSATVFFGRSAEQDAGEDFLLLLVLAPRASRDAMLPRRGTNWMKKLPDGIEILDQRITVRC